MELGCEKIKSLVGRRYDTIPIRQVDGVVGERRYVFPVPDERNEAETNE